MEKLLIECRKAKTKEIILANQKRQRHQNLNQTHRANAKRLENGYGSE